MSPEHSNIPLLIYISSLWKCDFNFPFKNQTKKFCHIYSSLSCFSLGFVGSLWVVSIASASAVYVPFTTTLSLALPQHNFTFSAVVSTAKTHPMGHMGKNRSSEASRNLTFLLTSFSSSLYNSICLVPRVQLGLKIHKIESKQLNGTKA